MTTEQLDTSDLDAEDLKALSEVSRKGYYHNRPKNENAPAPQRIEVERKEMIPENVPVKRAEFDEFQKKWDRIDLEEDAQEASISQSSATRMHTATQHTSPPSADESVVAQLMAMGFGEEESRAAAIATNNRADVAVDYLFNGGMPSAASRSAPIQADTSSIELLVEMGFSEKHARAALVACRNNLDSAVEHAAKLASDESSTKLQKARDALTQLESDVTALELDASNSPKVKRLRILEENLTQASCVLDSLDVDGGVASRAERRTELDRCNALDSRIGCLRNSILCSEAVPPSQSSTETGTRVVGNSGSHSVIDSSVAQDNDSATLTEVGMTQKRIADAERLRSDGNAAFKAEDYRSAVQHYSAALCLDSENVAILSNLALAELKLGDFEGAVVHATAANDLSGGFSAKAIFRKGQALEGLGRLVEACDAYQSALSIEPGDKLVRQRLQSCRKTVQDDAAANNTTAA